MNKQHDKISVIIPVYHEPIDIIKESLDSILQQTYKNIEILIGVDDPSNLEALEFITYFSKKNECIKVFVNRSNLGLAENLNNLLDHAEGVYIARMDADDVAHELRLEKQLEFLKQHNLNFVSGAYDSVDEDGNIIKVSKKKDLLNRDVRLIERYGNILTHPLWLVSKGVILQLKYRKVEPAEDYDLIARAIFDKNIQFGFMGQSLLQYRVRNNSESHKNPALSVLMGKYVAHSIKNNEIPDISKLMNIRNSKLKYSNYLKIFQIVALLKYKVMSIYINVRVDKNG